MRITIRMIGAMLALLVAGASQAQTYPTKQVRMICPYPPGGPTDVIARLVAQKLQEHLGGQFFVENPSGAGGALGAGNAANSAPDGSTLLVTTNDFAVGATTTKLSYDPVKNFAPISIVASAPQVIIANPSAGEELQELVDLGEERAWQIQLRQNEHRLWPVDHGAAVQARDEGRHDQRTVPGRSAVD